MRTISTIRRHSMSSSPYSISLLECPSGCASACSRSTISIAPRPIRPPLKAGRRTALRRSSDVARLKRSNTLTCVASCAGDRVLIRQSQDLGIYRNLCAVLGPRPLFWLLPQPMMGDGLSYPVNNKVGGEFRGDDCRWAAEVSNHHDRRRREDGAIV